LWAFLLNGKTACREITGDDKPGAPEPVQLNERWERDPVVEIADGAGRDHSEGRLTSSFARKFPPNAQPRSTMRSRSSRKLWPMRCKGRMHSPTVTDYSQVRSSGAL